MNTVQNPLIASKSPGAAPAASAKIEYLVPTLSVQLLTKVVAGAGGSQSDDDFTVTMM